jgi:hypothetical protein
MAEIGIDIGRFRYGIGSFLCVLIDVSASSAVQVSNTTISGYVTGTIAELFGRTVVLMVVIEGCSTWTDLTGDLTDDSLTV